MTAIARLLLVFAVLLAAGPSNSARLRGTDSTVCTGSPVVSGTAQALASLTISPRACTNVTATRTYQLFRDSVAVPGLFTTVGGGSWTYIVVAEDVGVTAFKFRETVTSIFGGTATADTGTIGPIIEATPNANPVNPGGALMATSSDPYIDSYRNAGQWTCGGCGKELVLTFSFPQAASNYGLVTDYPSAFQTTLMNWSAYNTSAQSMGRRRLRILVRGTPIYFVEIVETDTVHANFRFSSSSSQSSCGNVLTGVPGSADIWCNPRFATSLPGTLGWMNILHETLHGFGFKHVNDSFPTQMPTDRDAMEYSVMSYCSFIGQSIGTCTTTSTASGNFPQTLMQEDTQALQWFYGTSIGLSSSTFQRWQQSDTTLSWSSTTGLLTINGVAETDVPFTNKIMMSLPLGCAAGTVCTKTFDFTNYSPTPTCDLSAGGWMTLSAAQLGALQGGHTAAGNLYNPIAMNGVNVCNPP